MPTWARCCHTHGGFRGAQQGPLSERLSVAAAYGLSVRLRRASTQPHDASLAHSAAHWPALWVCCATLYTSPPTSACVSRGL